MSPRNTSGDGVEQSQRKRSAAAIEPSETLPVAKTRKTGTSALDRPSRHKRFYFSDGNLVFLVNNVLYNVHRYFFQQYSAHFSTMFSLPQPDGKPAEGKTDDNPIHLSSIVTTDELDRLLSIFYPVKISTFEMKTVKDWESVYALAVKWQFESVAEVASKQLLEVATPFDKIILSRKHPGLGGWLEDGFVAICTRIEILTVEEGRKLNRDDLVFIARFRETYWSVGRTLHRKGRVAEQIKAALDNPMKSASGLESGLDFDSDSDA